MHFSFATAFQININCKLQNNLPTLYLCDAFDAVIIKKSVRNAVCGGQKKRALKCQGLKRRDNVINNGCIMLVQRWALAD